MSTATEAPADAAVRRLIVLRDVAQLLGVGTATIERMHAAAKLPAPRKIGRANRWQLDELVEWMSRPKPNGELMNRKEWQPVWAGLVHRRG